MTPSPYLAGYLAGSAVRMCLPGAPYFPEAWCHHPPGSPAADAWCRGVRASAEDRAPPPSITPRISP